MTRHRPSSHLASPLLSPLGMPQEIALSRWRRASPWQKLGWMAWWACGLGLAGVAVTALTLTLTAPSAAHLPQHQAARTPEPALAPGSTARVKTAHLLVPLAEKEFAAE